jgi:hypothetical protein
MDGDRSIDRSIDREREREREREYLFWVARAIFKLYGDCPLGGSRAANLDLCLALTAFSSESSFTCNTYCDTGPPFLRSYQKDPWFSFLNAVLLAKEQSLPILYVLGLSGTRTHDLPDAKREHYQWVNASSRQRFDIIELVKIHGPWNRLGWTHNKENSFTCVYIAKFFFLLFFIRTTTSNLYESFQIHM